MSHIPVPTAKDFARAPLSFARKDGLPGSGCYSQVHKSNVPGFVVKTSNSLLTDAWPLWAAHVLTSAVVSPHFPDISTLVIEPTKGAFYAIMEELTPQVGYWENKAALGQATLDAPSGLIWYGMRLQERLDGTASGMDIYGFTEVISECYEWCLSVGIALRIDAHQDNVMLRRDVKVITDPFCFSNDREVDFSEAYLEELRRLAEDAEGRIIFI